MNLSFLGYQELKEKNIHDGLSDMAKRSKAGGFLHALAFYLFFSPQLQEQYPMRLWTGLAILLAGTAIRIYVAKYGPVILKGKNGIRNWRFIFTFASTSMMMVWSYCFSMHLLEFGFNSDSFMYVSAIIAVSGLSTAAYAFDLRNNILCQLSLLLPLVVLPPLLGLDSATPFAISVFAFMAYCIYVCFDLKKTKITILKTHELTVSQKNQLTEVNSELSNANHIMGTIFDSVDVAFMVFDLDGQCINSPSAISKEIFKDEILGRNISSLISSENFSKKQIKQWFHFLGSEKHRFNDIIKMGPTETVENNKNLVLSYYPMRDQLGKLTSIIVIARDVTEEIENTEKIKSAEKRSALILQIYQNKNDFKSFLSEFPRFLHEHKNNQESNLQDLSFSLHTWKSIARINSAFDVAGSIQKVELTLTNSENLSDQEILAKKTTLLDQLIADFNQWLSKESQLLSEMNIFAKEESVEIRKSDLDQIKSVLQNKTEANEFNKIAPLFSHDNLEQLLKNYESQILKTSHNLGKNVHYSVSGPSEPIYIEKNQYNGILQNLIHIFNNCIDHGIGTEKMRTASGKPEQGHIKVSFNYAGSTENYIRLVIEDDGQGIDREKLKTRLQESGIDPSSLKNDNELLMTIFEKNISTKTEKNQISGFGIGMTSVKKIIGARGGQIDILKSDKEGTRFEIIFPLHLEKSNFSVSA